MRQLDAVFGCKNLTVQENTKNQKTKTEEITWNKEVTVLIHPKHCTCFKCTNKHLNRLNMEVAALKANAIAFNKDYQKSLQYFQQIYEHWNASSATSYSGILMDYSNCLISNRRVEESNCILYEALDASNDYAQAQDISHRLLCNSVKDQYEINELPSYADNSRPKRPPPKAKSTCKETRSRVKTKERPAYVKKSNLRY